MLIILVPVAVAVLAGWIVWKLHDIVDSVPRRNRDFGEL